MENPFEPNITLTIEEINPFTPTSLGEGGFNSGVKLKKFLLNSEYNTSEKRVKKHNLNAQRLYRQRNREKYNKNMLKLYNAKYGADAPDTSDKTDRLDRMKVINMNYRLKKKLNNPPPNAIDTALKQEFRKIPKKVGRKKKGEASREEKMKEFISNQANRDRVRNELIQKYDTEYKDFLAKHPNFNFSNTPVYKVGEYQYKKYDPTGLEIGIKTKTSDAGENRAYNLGELKNYYESVLTDIANPPLLDQHQKGSRFYGTKSQSADYSTKRNTHTGIFKHIGPKYRQQTEASETRMKVKEEDEIKQIPQGRKKD